MRSNAEVSFVVLFWQRYHCQRCQMAYFQTKNPDLGKFWRALKWKVQVYFMSIWFILWLFGTFKVIWHIFSPFWYVVPNKNWQPFITLPTKDGKRPIECYRFRPWIRNCEGRWFFGKFKNWLWVVVEDNSLVSKRTSLLVYLFEANFATWIPNYVKL
jgi:hypothetical protein